MHLKFYMFPSTLSPLPLSLLRLPDISKCVWLRRYKDKMFYIIRRLLKILYHWLYLCSIHSLILTVSTHKNGFKHKPHQLTMIAMFYFRAFCNLHCLLKLENQTQHENHLIHFREMDTCTIIVQFTVLN